LRIFEVAARGGHLRFVNSGIELGKHLAVVNARVEVGEMYFTVPET